MKKKLFIVLFFYLSLSLNAQNTLVEYALNKNVINRIIITDTATHSETRFAEGHDNGLDVTKESFT